MGGPWQEFANDTTKIVHADALEYLATIPDGSIDLIFADPPYNIGKRYANSVDKWPSEEAYLDWCYAWINLCIQKLSKQGSIYLMTSTQNMPYFDIYLRNKLHILSRIVWHYDSSGVQAKKYYGSLYEPILFAVKDQKNYVFNADDIKVEARTGAKRKLIDYRGTAPKQYNTHKVPGNVWYFPRVRYRMPEYEKHPSQKPEALMQRIILASSDPGQIVLDPFSGTFTTCALAQKLGRRSIGIEKDEEYLKVGLRRLGLAESYQGEKLMAPEKNFEAKR